MGSIQERNGDDSRIRTGTVWTATAHAVTAIVGSGVLALPWSVAQLGWVLGPIVLIFFSYATFHTACFLSDSYRSPHPVNGTRNYTYMDAIRSFLGKKDVVVCGCVQKTCQLGTMVGYTVTAAMSILAIEVTQCHHTRGSNASCNKTSVITSTLLFGAAEVVLSQFPNLEDIAFISYIAAAMSFIYSFLGLYLSALSLRNGHGLKGSLFNSDTHLSLSNRIWNSFQALGNIAFAFGYSTVLVEIQDTLKSPPSENKTMKKASSYGIGATTLFYITLGCVGYGAFGNNTPGNILTGIYEPYWVIDVANIAVLIHLVGAYQVFAQPLFAFYEQWMCLKWPNTDFFHKIYTCKIPFTKASFYKFTLCKLLLRTALVILTTLTALLIPFFNAVVGLIGSVAFWPLTIYYPIAMHIVQANIKRGENKWVFLQLLSFICLLVSFVSALGSIVNIADSLKTAKMFHIQM
ncbi:Amino acid permease I, putative, expressed [Zostera marina]|uniref:Amino acid permease I, putative, expressed n=1 Tax=Zostera marina TaxID=29655 RepID=A0A0K9NJY6_ZOSMR|nr:Amino acid permease I, putative, expressed [Zostera marina]